jgi:type I restriction enzyme S subunit
MTPSLEEQKKIANILSTWDRAIELKNNQIQEMINLKKSTVQKIFSSDNCQEVKLSRILTETHQKSTGNEEVFSVSVHKGVINQIEHLGRSFSAKKVDNYNLVSYGNIIYTKSPTGEFPYGIIKQSKVKEDVIVSPLYGIYKPKSFATGVILDAFFESPINTYNLLIPIVQKGAKNTINITNTNFLTGKILFPKNENNIEFYGKTILSIEQYTELLKEELSELVKYKKGLMQQLLTGKIRVQA